jgi:ribosomal protein S18 acetylase RimI-like enzyme
MTNIVIRPAGPEDLELLWEFLAMAAYEPDAAAAKAVPMVTTFLNGWQRQGDFGFIAEQNRIAIGAIWARQFASRDESWFYIDDRTPEISIGVRNQARGQGFGQTLLRAMIAEAARRGLRLCLNVRHTNPARRLYERMGFRVLPELTVTNRVGGQSFGMLWDDPGRSPPHSGGGRDGL